MSWNLCLLRPDRVRALVNLSVAFMPRHPSAKPLHYFRRAYGDDYYVCKFQMMACRSPHTKKQGLDIIEISSTPLDSRQLGVVELAGLLLGPAELLSGGDKARSFALRAEPLVVLQEGRPAKRHSAQVSNSFHGSIATGYWFYVLSANPSPKL
ncbi:hypothetical protein ZWY2020_003406 [Hordeum vulgare]|nr:hypothetical protein ZWY2020_003406 [Hordeum vulgare]